MTPGAGRPTGVESTWRAAPRMANSLTKYLLFRRHLFAYEEASRQGSKEGLAADIGCGLGYALQLLGAARRPVIAIDMASGALAELETDGQLWKLRGSAASLPLRSGSMSLVVSFQVIEHLPRESAVAMLTELRRVLAPGGRAFVTTPNARWRLLPGMRPWNPYHAVEYGPRGISTLCDAAGIPRSQIRGVMGAKEAQERELARVRPDRLGLRSPGLTGALRRLFGVLGAQRADEKVLPEHEGREWFTLSDDYESGLDFWLEVRP